MRKLLVLLMILATLLTGCGGGTTTTTEEAGGDTGGDTGSAVELSESFSGETGSVGTLTLNYPSGWTQSGTANALILESGEEGLWMEVGVQPFTGSQTPVELIAPIAADGATDGGTASEVESVTVGEHEGAVVTTTRVGSSTVIMIIKFSDAFVLLTLTTPDAQLEANRPILDAVAASLTLGS